MNTENKTILITGANRGIGRALLEEALKRGARRVYAGTRQPFTHSDGRVTPLTLDVTNAGQIQDAVEKVGALDILVNNAGVDLHDDLSDRANLDRHLAVNLFGTYGVSQPSCRWWLVLTERWSMSYRWRPWRGKFGEAPYFFNYDRWPWPWKLAVGELDGEPVVIILQRGADTWTPYSAIRMNVIDRKIERIADYIHCPWMIPAAASASTEGRT